MPFSHVEEALEDIREGKPIILVDDEDRENEGDLVVAAEKITPSGINFMAKHGRGLICLTLTRERAEHLELPLMVTDNDAPYKTAFTVSIEAREGVTTGISAADRARTVQVAIDENAGPRDLVRPGHIFPLIAKDGGVLVRTGHTEGSVDLARLAGLKPAGVICEILNEDGTMARRPDLEKFADEFDLKIITIADLIKYRRVKELLVHRYAEADVPLIYGDFRMIVYRSDVSEDEHIAFVKGEVADGGPVLVRVQSSTVLSELLNFVGRWTKNTLGQSLRRVEEEGRGVVLCLSMENAPGRIGDLLRGRPGEGGPPPQPNPKSSMPDYLREYGVGAQILADLGVKKMRLLTNHPRKIPALEGFDLEVVETVALEGGGEKLDNVRVLKQK